MSICQVCKSAGKPCDHATRGSYFPEREADVIMENWPVIKPFGKTTDCPYIRCMVCPNKNCFNGKDGIIRYPEFAHTKNYCPCDWYPQPNSENHFKNNELSMKILNREINKIISSEEHELAYENHFIDEMDNWMNDFDLKEQASLHDIPINPENTEQFIKLTEQLDYINDILVEKEKNGDQLTEKECELMKNYIAIHKEWSNMIRN
mgnify:CR=1 FL=1|tara:strand:+ start:869 stop:1486 length:618 start_codon:yes stop_codon:yes gene_type:complete